MSVDRRGVNFSRRSSSFTSPFAISGSPLTNSVEKSFFNLSAGVWGDSESGF